MSIAFLFQKREEQHINLSLHSLSFANNFFFPLKENLREFDYNTLIQYRSMHRIYALKYTEASQTFNQFSNMKKNLRVFSVGRVFNTQTQETRGLGLIQD